MGQQKIVFGGASTGNLLFHLRGSNYPPAPQVFKGEKTGPDGKTPKRRIQLVAGWHKQKKGINYERPSLGCNMPLFTLCGQCAQMDWEIHQIEIKSAYLNDTFDAVLYMITQEVT